MAKVKVKKGDHYSVKFAGRVNVLEVDVGTVTFIHRLSLARETMPLAEFEAGITKKHEPEP